MPNLPVEIWSDIACPWCYVGKRRFEAALARFEHGGSVAVRWRSFELNPAAPRIEALGGTYAERLAAKYGTTLARGREMIRTMTETAAAEGLEFRFDRIRPGNTFDAHRLTHFAAAHGLQDAAEERLMRAYLTEGEALGERSTLVRLAAEIGLDAEAARALLEGAAFEDDVRADEESARRRGIRGVPYFAIGGRHGLSGAQPPELLLQALRDAWRELPAAARGGVDGPVGGAACGPDGCDA